MADNAPNFIAITVPHALQFNMPVREAINNMTKGCGGCTRTEAFGEWFDNDGKLHAERVLIFKWNFTDAKAGGADRQAREIVDALFTAGEKAVFKERNYTRYAVNHLRAGAPGYMARIIHNDKS